MARGRPQILQRSRMRIFSRGGISLRFSRLSAGFASSALWPASRSSCLRNLTSFASVDIALPRYSLQSTRSSTLAERHAERPQQLARLVVVAAGDDEGHVHALGEGHLVRVD